MSRHLFIGLSLALAIAGCSANKEHTSSYDPSSKPAVKADRDVKNSFAVEETKAPEASRTTRPDEPRTAIGDLAPTENKAKIRLAKAALEKEFLWHAQIIMQLQAPSFNGLKSRVVAFRQRGETLYLLEANHGHTVTNDLPQNLILASFPITAQDETSVEFDFNKGMSDIFMASDWRASDFDGAYHQGEAEFTSVPVRHSYIEKAEMNNKNELVIHQHALITLTPFGLGNLNVPVEVRYYLSPYAPNMNYSPVETVDFDRMGFFEVAPLLLEGSLEKVFATRFDPAQDKPIVFAVSPNTPAEYKQAVRDGVLYWNRAFGYEKVKVVDAPAGVSAPNSEYNIVQWIPFDAAGGAYADAQMDPRTGEIRHAQVFMTSAFAFISKSRAQMLYRRFGLKPAGRPTLSLAGFAQSKLCDRDNTKHLHSLLEDALTNNLSDDKILEISRDYVREVVAHEVGHTLGLRHNFAGSLSANFELSELPELFKKYLTNLEVKPGLQASSSVMEYQDFPSAVMTGRQMALPGNAYSYDLKAIGVLYKGATLTPSETPIYCTDSDHGAYLGCTVWDQGPSPLADAVYNEQLSMDTFANALIESIIYSKTKPFGEKAELIEDLKLDPEARASGLLARRALITQLMTDKAKDLRVYRSFNKIDGLNKKAVAEKMLATTTSEAEKLGGLNKLLASPAPALAANWTESFNKLIESEYYKSGIGYNGQPYTLTDAEIAQGKALAADYFEKVQAALALADVQSLAKHTGRLLDAPLIDTYADLLAARMNEYLTSENGEVIQERVTLKDNKSAILRLPIYKYSHPVRLASAKLLLDREAEAIDWGIYQYSVVQDQLKTKVKSLLMDNDIDSIPVEKNSRPVAKWLLENKKIMSALKDQ